MKRYRVKAVGLGLALWAGPLHAGDEPQPPPRPAAPAALPASIRPAEWAPAGTGDPNTVWLPARKPSNAPAAVKPPTPNVSSPAAPSVVTPAADKRPAGFGSLPDIPATSAGSTASVAAPTVPPPARSIPTELPPLPLSQPRQQPVAADALPVIPPLPNAMPSRQPGDQVPAPRPVPPPSPKRPPSSDSPIPPASDSPPRVLPPPSPLPELTRPADCELPTAPPELMVPVGVPVPGKHGTFGSAPIHISKDYPPLRELIRHDDDGGGWWGRDRDRGWWGPDGDGTALATNRFYARGEFLMWWVRPGQIPALATTSVSGGLGFLGDPGTRTLIGPGSFGDPLRLGMRVRAGYWFNDCGTCGIDGSFFFLGRQTTSQAVDAGTFPTITRPIFAPNFPGEFGEVVALPGFARGSLAVNATSSLWGFDANLTHALCRTCNFRSMVFAGYRFLGLNESLGITENIVALPGNPNDPAGTQVTVHDQFTTRNRFNGGQVGYAAERNWGRFSLDGRASVALGDTHQTLDIAGSQTRLRPGMTAPDVFTGGLLATGPNLGHFSRDRFSVVPEVMLNVGYWITPNVKAYVGYNFLLWTNVIRPGDQIDRVVDVTLVPNPPPGVPFSGQLRPQPTFHQSNLWVNGIQFGLMGRW